MSTTFKIAALPALLAMVALLVWQAGLVFADDAGDGESSAALSAPTVELIAASACNPKKPRTYLFASYTAVEGADSYQFRAKWGRSGSFGRWLPARRGPGTPWPVYTNRYVDPGETYVVQVRAVDDRVPGAVGVGRHSYTVGDFDAPSGVQVSYRTDGDAIDYSRARLTWRGDDRSGGWFAVQQRVTGKRWQSGSWEKASRVDGDGSSYYRDVSGLDPAKGYEFRVTGHTPDCQASPWSKVAVLEPAPDPPTFETSVGTTADGAMLGVWVASPHQSVEYYTFRLGDGEAVKLAMPAAQHRFDVEMGNSYRVCATAGNAGGVSEVACRTVAAQPSSPIESIRMAAGEQMQGVLEVYWDLVPMVNPTWYDDDPGSTHAPPAYRVALREATADAGEWPNSGTEFRTVYQEGREGGARFDGLKGNTEYEVAVQSLYYGEAVYARANGRTLMNPVRNLTVGFDDDNGGRAVVAWDAPEGGGQTGYVVKLRRTYSDYSKLASRQDSGADAVSANFDGLRSNRWYHVRVKAVGEGESRSTVRTCYFRQGVGGSQNTVAARWTGGPSCALAD